ncbi:MULTISPECIES: ABC transporter permease [Marinomonas]|uniref:ABC transporter permease n=1 Tax=Marinomonas arctica TaxID=383750 RepID=A0A7H1J8H8_9GAMM|nr:MULTISPECIES: ABC transporter permease [Marinomonas]MCS7487616.1 branched-chain amino acid ABC transporter permease [Marinomonas sp. BSi20414]QNT06794.1 ABC transporter permease [Marinomonas arctica]GGN23468.1 ABC transporter permease [Marinomonas arctica]
MLRRFIYSREGILSMIVLAMFLAVGTISPDFISVSNSISIFNDTSILIMLALGQMLVILTRCIDLSVAANVAFTGMVVAMVNQYFPTLNMFVLMLLALGIGAFLGAINGLFVWLLKVPSIVITLGTMSIYRGATFLLSDGAWVNSHQMSEAFIGLPRYEILSIPVLAWMAIITILLAFWTMKFSVWGRNFYSAGGNPMAAFYSGVNVGKVQFYAFLVSGTLAGLCGYLWVSRFAVAYVDVANGFELQVIAACVIGGVSIVGGLGTVVGCVIGALFIGVVNNALPIIGVSPFWQMAISGLVIIIAVVANASSDKDKARIILRKPEASVGSAPSQSH